MARPLDPAEAFNRQPPVPRSTPLRTPNVPGELELTKDALRQTRPGTPVGQAPRFADAQRAYGGQATQGPVLRPGGAPLPPLSPEQVAAGEAQKARVAAARAPAPAAPAAATPAAAPAVTDEAAKAGRWRALAGKVPGAQTAKNVAGALRAGGRLAMGAVAPVATAFGAYNQARDAQTAAPIAGGNPSASTVPTWEDVQRAQAAPGFDSRSALQEFTPEAIVDSLTNPGFAMSLGPAGSAASGAATALRNVGGRLASMGASVLGPTAVTGLQAGTAIGAEMGNRAGPRSFTPGKAPETANLGAQSLGTFNGREISRDEAAQRAGQLQTMAPGDFQSALQAAGGRIKEDPNSITSVLRDMMRGGMGDQQSGSQGAIIGNGGIGSQDAFDKLKAEVIDAHGGGRVAKGTMARKLMEIESMRQGRQTADQQNATSMRGQDLTAQSAAANTRANLANTMADYDVQSRAAKSSALRDKAEAAKFQSEMGEKGFDRFQKLTTGLFQKVGEDGKPTNDTAKEERFRQYLMGSDMANADGGLLTLDPQQQAALISQQRANFEMQEAANEKSGNWGGMASNRYSPATNVRDVELGDLRRGLGVGTYLNQEFNPLSDGRVVQQENGQARSVDELVDDDADRLAEIQNALRSRR